MSYQRSSNENIIRIENDDGLLTDERLRRCYIRILYIIMLCIVLGLMFLYNRMNPVHHKIYYPPTKSSSYVPTLPPL